MHGSHPMGNALSVVEAISTDIFQLFEQLPSRAMAVLPALSAGFLQGTAAPWGAACKVTAWLDAHGHVGSAGAVPEDLLCPGASCKDRAVPPHAASIHIWVMIDLFILIDTHSVLGLHSASRRVLALESHQHPPLPCSASRGKALPHSALPGTGHVPVSHCPQASGFALE